MTKFCRAKQVEVLPGRCVMPMTNRDILASCHSQTISAECIGFPLIRCVVEVSCALSNDTKISTLESTPGSSRSQPMGMSQVPSTGSPPIAVDDFLLAPTTPNCTCVPRQPTHLISANAVPFEAMRTAARRSGNIQCVPLDLPKGFVGGAPSASMNRKTGRMWPSAETFASHKNSTKEGI